MAFKLSVNTESLNNSFILDAKIWGYICDAWRDIFYVPIIIIVLISRETFYDDMWKK